jgi:hypothetical protein
MFAAATATLPRGISVASITYHLRSRVSVLAMKVDIFESSVIIFYWGLSENKPPLTFTT